MGIGKDQIPELPSSDYCRIRSAFQARLTKMQNHFASEWRCHHEENYSLIIQLRQKSEVILSTTILVSGLIKEEFSSAITFPNGK